nr:MAG: hypothetical protein EDM05_04920 [Leptolyngbya sp. IPPAS B-1204]
MLALVDDEVHALRVVQLALNVDLTLGARLAGEVKPKFQRETVKMISALEVPEWLKVELWGKTRSSAATPSLIQSLDT